MSNISTDNPKEYDPSTDVVQGNRNGGTFTPFILRSSRWLKKLGRAFLGDYESIAASTDRTAALTYGGVVTWDGIVESMSAAGTYTLFNETGQLQIDHVQATANAAAGKLQVSVTTSAGTFVVVTSDACLTYGDSVIIVVSVANPRGGSIGPSAVTVTINDEEQSLTTSTEYTGTILPTTSGTLFLMAKSASSQIAYGFVREVRWENNLCGTSPKQPGSMSSSSTSRIMTPAAMLYFRSLGKTISKVACGPCHILVLTTDGYLYGMGRNDYGQLGTGTTTSQTTPVQIATGVASMSAGSLFSLYVTTGGVLYGMGCNDYGQLGDGTTTSQTSPVQIATGVASASAGASHSLYVTTGGVLYGMGLNNFGQLGTGDTTNVTTASGVQIATGVASFSAGFLHSLYVTTDGVLYGMGRNNLGQLGTGGTKTVTTAGGAQIASSVASCATGGNFSLYVTTDGYLYGMGRNDGGQLGNHSTYRVVEPKGGIKIAFNVSSAAGGGDCLIYSTTDGDFYMMGQGQYGQLDGHYRRGNLLADFSLTA